MDGSKMRLWLGIALVSFHLGISIVIVVFGGRELRKLLGDDFRHIITLLSTLTYVQCSLIGTWAMLGKGSYWVRLPLSFLLLLWIGYSLLCLVYGSNPEYYDQVLFYMCTQYFCIAGLIFLFQIILKLLKRDSHLDSLTKFSMGTLMFSVALIAVSLGIGKLVIQHFGLTMDSFTETYLTETKVIMGNSIYGVFNALAVVLMLPALWQHHWRMKLVLLIPLLILLGILSVIEYKLYSYYIMPVARFHYCFPNLRQAFFFYITVFPFWRWKTNSEESPEIETDALALDGIKD